MELVALDKAVSPVLYSSDKMYMSLLAAQQHLLSCGPTHVQSSNAADHPIINPNYFSVPFDVKVATEGTAYLRKVAATPQYATILGTEIYPGQGTDLQNYTISAVSTQFHPVSTASMLLQGQGGIINTSLRVYGTSNVRIVDASIVPLHISAHIKVTVYGIAEKAADLILTGL